MFCCRYCVFTLWARPYLLFWYQVFTCVSLRFNLSASNPLSATLKYFWQRNLRSKTDSCAWVKVVLRLRGLRGLIGKVAGRGASVRAAESTVGWCCWWMGPLSGCEGWRWSCEWWWWWWFKIDVTDVGDAGSGVKVTMVGRKIFKWVASREAVAAPE